MTIDKERPNTSPDHLSETPHLATALESDRFKQFLDHMPIALAVSQLQPTETITYANRAFENLVGEAAGAIVGRTWDILPGMPTRTDTGLPLHEARLAPIP